MSVTLWKLVQGMPEGTDLKGRKRDKEERVRRRELKKRIQNERDKGPQTKKEALHCSHVCSVCALYVVHLYSSYFF